MSEICIIGEKEFIYSFKGLGISIFPVESEKELEESLNKVIKEGFSIIYLTETYLENLKSKIERLSKDLPVAIVTISAEGEIKGFGWRRLKKTVEKAIGADLLKD